MPIHLPSQDVPESEKRSYSEADVHGKLFEADMRALGYPPRSNTQADGEHFLEQGRLALRRLRTRQDRARQGFYDGLYLLGNAPLVLCELKRFDALESRQQIDAALRQLTAYATSEDFAVPPPFLLLYNGRPDRLRFLRLRQMPEGTLLDASAYEELPEVWTWEQVTRFSLTGRFAEEVVDRARLLEILLHHLDELEDDLRRDVAHAVRIAANDERPAMLSPFGRWLFENPAALARVRRLYQQKVAEVGRDNERAVVEEMVTQAALNYLNKMFFLALCEDRNLAGFYRILRQFLPTTKAQTTPTTAAVFLGLLRRKIKDSTGAWSESEQDAYRALRQELIPEIRDHVIEQNNWWQLIRVAFDLAEERFPLVYREDAYDYFSPSKEVLAELVYDLSTKSFSALSNRHVGDIYQGLLSSRRRAGGRQQAKLGAFYTPRGDVEYMVSRLGLTRDSRVLDPCMGSGHFLEGLHGALLDLHRSEGIDAPTAHHTILERQLWGADIDTFAASLAAIRLFLLDEHATAATGNLFVHDMLLHSPERPGRELFSAELLAAEGRERAEAERAVTLDPGLDDVAPIDAQRFDAVVGNPPYGARKPEYKRRTYAELYGRTERDRRAGSVATGADDTYGMFFVNGIERLREGGRLCLITNDSFRSLTTYTALRRHILDRCKIVEILLTDTGHFEGVSFAFAGMAITTLERCSDPAARRASTIRLVDTIRDPRRFDSPPAEKVTELRQEEYEALPETPFFVGVPREVFESARSSGQVRDVARGRQGLATAEDRRFLAGIGGLYPGLTQTVEASQVTTALTTEEQAEGAPPGRPHWVPFAKGEGFGDYWRPPRVAIDWSRSSVEELERRDRWAAGTSRKPRFQNRSHYFKPGLSYSVVTGGRVSVRLMPSGAVFGHKGSAVFVDDASVDELFLLGYLNSALATYLMKKIVNTTATADVGYIEKLPFRRPDPSLHEEVVERVGRIVAALKEDLGADVRSLRDEVDDLIFDLFEIHESRAEVRRFFGAVGRVERDDQVSE